MPQHIQWKGSRRLEDHAHRAVDRLGPPIGVTLRQYDLDLGVLRVIVQETCT
jgi:hypothetical protein